MPLDTEPEVNSRIAVNRTEDPVMPAEVIIFVDGTATGIRLTMRGVREVGEALLKIYRERGGET